MNYELSLHAQTVMTERLIPVEWLERTLRQPARIEPDKTDPGLIHHQLVIPEHGDRVLRVVFNNQVAPRRIVTLHFDRRLKGKL